FDKVKKNREPNQLLFGPTFVNTCWGRESGISFVIKFKTKPMCPVISQVSSS
ncbi:unnamed protein product, partial [Prunus brigantina]